MRRALLLAGAALSLAAAPALAPGDYRIDPRTSRIEMNVGGMLRARFTDFDGQVELPGSHITSAVVHFTTRVESVTTGDSGRDKQLRGERLLNAGKFPTMEFHSTRIQPRAKAYVLHGNLTVKGVTKPASVEFTLQKVQGQRFQIDGTTALSSREFGIEYGNPFPGKDIQIRLQLAASRKP